MEQLFNKEFLRMQKLAGLSPTNTDPMLNIIVEFYLYENYYSKGVLAENLDEGIFSKAKEKAKKWLEKNKLKPTEGYIIHLIQKFEKLAKAKIGRAHV